MVVFSVAYRLHETTADTRLRDVARIRHVTTAATGLPLRAVARTFVERWGNGGTLVGGRAGGTDRFRWRALRRRIVAASLALSIIRFDMEIDGESV